MEVNNVTHKPPEQDLKELWRNLAVEGPGVTVQELQERSQMLRYRMNRGSIAFRISFAVHVLVIIARVVWGTPENLFWIRGIEFATFLLWSFFLPYERAARSERPMTILPRSTNGFDFYRTQLEARIDTLRGHDSTFVIVYASFFWAIFYARLYPVLGIPILIVFSIIAFNEHQRKKRELPRVQDELRALRTFERQTQEPR
jgi:hypothetical protein